MEIIAARKGVRERGTLAGSVQKRYLLDGGEIEIEMRENVFVLG